MKIDEICFIWLVKYIFFSELRHTERDRKLPKRMLIEIQLYCYFYGNFDVVDPGILNGLYMRKE